MGFQLDSCPSDTQAGHSLKLAEEFGWKLASVRGDHHNFKHPASRFIVTIVHPQKDVPVGRAVDTAKKIRLEIT
jgi:predicted RNA binding protein YcfA (HicA-like mRNA interferase family)